LLHNYSAVSEFL